MPKWDVMRSKDLKQVLGVDEAVVLKSVQQGKIGPDDLLRREGSQDWRRVAELRDWLFMSPTERWELEARERDAAATLAYGEALPQSARSSDSGGFKPATTHLAARAEPGRQSAPDDDEEEIVLVRRNMDVEEFDLTPMVDMTFLLNMFFMLTTSYVLLRSIDVPAPNINQNKAEGSKQSMSLEDLRADFIIAEIRADNTILIDDKEVSRKELRDALKARIQETNKNELIVQAADEAYHEIVVAVLDAGNEAGMQRVRLATSSGDG